VERLMAMMREAYAAPRARDDAPLLRAGGWFLAYRKGLFVMHALREYAGDERVGAALRSLLVAHGAGEPPLPTSLDLYRELRAAIPESLHGLLSDLFEKNTWWELAAKQVAAVQEPSGSWTVTLDVRARKVVIDASGREDEVPMDDPVEVGVFADVPGGGPQRALYLQMHRITSGDQRITVIVPERPARAGIDPRHLLIDGNPADNARDAGPFARPGSRPHIGSS
jgi:hypothetical protein